MQISRHSLSNAVILTVKYPAAISGGNQYFGRIRNQVPSTFLLNEHVYSTKMSDNTKSLDRRDERYDIQKKLITHEHTHKIVSVHCQSQSIHVME